MNEPIIISQSFMKALDEDKGGCPAQAKAIYIDGLRREPSEAMIRGNYFETLLLGSTDSGEVVAMERTSKGEKSAAQVRVEQNANDAKHKLRQEFGMDWQHPRLHITKDVDVNGTVYRLRARTDMITSFKHPQHGLLPKVILDWKITDSIYSTFRPFAWGDPYTMDHLQAKFYMWMYWMVYGEKIPFVYQVMDVSTKRAYKFIYMELSDMAVNEVKQAIRSTAALIENYQRTEWPTVASADNCPGCPLRDKCPKAASGIRVQDIKL